MNRILSFVFLLAACLLAAGCPQQPQSESASAPQTPAARPESRAEPAYSLVPAPAPPVVQPLPAQPAWQPVARKTVILDAGHGGDNLGAAYFGLNEKDVNLSLVLKTAAILRSMGVNVLLSRQTDVFIPLPGRSAFANKNPNAIFVSVHCNASDKNPQARGIETYILSQQFSDDEQCRRALARYNVTGKNREESSRQLDKLTRVCRAEGPLLAASLQRSLVGRLGDPDRGVKTGNLAVLRETFFCPAVLVEVGFISNYPTARKMASAAWRDQVAQALAEGIVNYLRKGG